MPLCAEKVLLLFTLVGFLQCFTLASPQPLTRADLVIPPETATIYSRANLATLNFLFYTHSLSAGLGLLWSGKMLHLLDLFCTGFLTSHMIKVAYFFTSPEIPAEHLAKDFAFPRWLISLQVLQGYYQKVLLSLYRWAWHCKLNWVNNFYYLIMNAAQSV